MDLAGIILAAIGGAIGGGVAGLVSTVLPKNDEGKTGPLGMILVIGLAVVGMRLLPDVIDPYIGPAIRDAVGVDVAAELDTVFEEQPLLAALAEADPGEAAAARARVEEAYRNGGLEAARQASFDEGVRLGSSAMAVYAPRTSDEALRGTMQAMIDFGEGTMETPRLCYALFYNQVPGNDVRPDEIADAGQSAAAMGIQASMAEMIRQAAPEAVPFDVENAMAVQADLQAYMAANHQPEDTRFLLGIVPSDDDELRVACSVMTGLLSFQLEHQHGLDFMRMGFSGG